MRIARFERATALCLGLIVGNAPAIGQMPPLPPEVAEIGACVCLRQTVDVIRGDMDGKQQALADVRARLEEATRRLEAERSRIDVNDSAAVARFRQQVEQRDALFKRSGSAVSEAGVAVERYNTRVGQYNARCANRPLDPAIVARIQPTLSCPPPY
jgi:hypothetical protein